MPKLIAEVAGTETSGISQLRYNVVDRGHAVLLPQESLVQGFCVYTDADASIGLGYDEECRNPWAGFAHGLNDAEVFQPSKLRLHLVSNAQRKSAERHLHRRPLLIDLKMDVAF